MHISTIIKHFTSNGISKADRTNIRMKLPLKVWHIFFNLVVKDYADTQSQSIKTRKPKLVMRFFFGFAFKGLMISEKERAKSKLMPNSQLLALFYFA